MDFTAISVKVRMLSCIHVLYTYIYICFQL